MPKYRRQTPKPERFTGVREIDRKRKRLQQAIKKFKCTIEGKRARAIPTVRPPTERDARHLVTLDMPKLAYARDGLHPEACQIVQLGRFSAAARKRETAELALLDSIFRALSEHEMVHYDSEADKLRVNRDLRRVLLLPQTNGEVVPICCEQQEEEIQQLPRATLDATAAQVQIVDSEASLDEAMDRLWRSHATIEEDWRHRLVGFDAEFCPKLHRGGGWKPHAASVLPIATPGHIHLFMLKHLRGSLRPLQEYLACRDLFKCNVVSAEDYKQLRYMGLVVRNIVDAHLNTRMWIHLNNLHTLSASLLELNLARPAEVRDSNWDAPALSDAQIEFAALDAWANREVALRLQPLLPRTRFLHMPFEKQILSAEDRDLLSLRKQSAGHKPHMDDDS